MAKANKINLIISVVLMIALLFLLVFVVGVGCGQQQQEPQKPEQGKQQRQQQEQQIMTLFSDDFAGESTGAVPSKWTPVTKEGLTVTTQGMTQVNNQYGLVMNLKGSFVKTGQSNWKDYTIDTDFKISNAGEHTGPEVGFYLQDDDNYYLFSTNTQPTGTNYILYKVTNGERYEVEKRASKKIIDDESWHTLQISIKGAEFKAIVDDEIVLEATTDGSFTQGAIALMSHPFSSIFFDNVVVIGTTS